ncbi:MAG: SAM-dependent methyltransferase, partial [Oscillospiraceae bacterium]|nr:SAM-dependent methyltransferase [Oscillospiraceae bacterium]
MSDSTRETLTHGTVVHLSAAHRFGTDGLLLADFCRPRRAERAADLCSGCGIVALRWHDEGHRGPCTALELNGEAHGLLAEALAEQPEAAAHIGALQGDLRTFAPAEAGQYHLAACYPPYFAG